MIPTPATEDLTRRLAASVAALAAELNLAPSEPVTADHVCQTAVELLGPCHAASITIREGRQSFQTIGASDDVVRQLDALQYELNEGPCVDVAADRVDSVLSNDLHDEPRWPRWAPEATSAGQLAVVAAPLLAGERRLGAINFYSTVPEAWAQDDYHLAQLFTAHAALPLSYAHEVSGLTTAISNRHTIGVAQGILMRDYDLDINAAFKVLQTLSAERNVKVQQLAQQIVAEAEQSRGR